LYLRRAELNYDQRSADRCANIPATFGQGAAEYTGEDFQLLPPLQPSYANAVGNKDKYNGRQPDECFHSSIYQATIISTSEYQ
jgi:hypothetical protein